MHALFVARPIPSGLRRQGRKVCRDGTHVFLRELFDRGLHEGSSNARTCSVNRPIRYAEDDNRAILGQKSSARSWPTTVRCDWASDFQIAVAQGKIRLLYSCRWRRRAIPKRPVAASQKRPFARLLDYSVCSHQNGLSDRDAECSGGLNVHHAGCSIDRIGTLHVSQDLVETLGPLRFWFIGNNDKNFCTLRPKR